ncbi:hypothetical protein ADL26_05660 [Thermoactinomyces vulgaris]|jgi:multidrug transporter EmrE-like cation transporter|nr:hypothetical protein ADL26_05660 [Thermoactinomyces vulgaris]
MSAEDTAKKKNEKPISIQRAWLYVLLGGLLEIVWATGLKTGGISGILIVLMIISFELLVRALKALPIGTTYAAFTGIGTVGLIIVDALYLRQPMSGLQIVLTLVLIASIIGLKLTSDTKGKE